MACLILVLTVADALAAGTTASAEDHTVYMSTDRPYDYVSGNQTLRISGTIDGETVHGICANASYGGLFNMGGAANVNYEKLDFDACRTLCILTACGLYGRTDPALSPLLERLLVGGYNENDLYIVCHMALSIAYSGDDKDTNGEDLPEPQYTDAHELPGRIAALADSDEGISYLKKHYTFYKFKTAEGYQDYIGANEGNSGGFLRIRKESLYPAVSRGRLYTLNQAVYEVFTDENAGTMVAELSADEEGKTETIELACGRYYIREKQTPQGFLLDTGIYEAEILPGEETSLTLYDEPLHAGAGLLLKKTDADTDSSRPQGGAALEGAEYEMSLYDCFGDAVNSKEPPLYTWYLKTDANGEIYFDETHYLGGDELLKNTAGEGILPLGTLKIREVKAPTGYQLDEEVYVSEITAENEKVQISQLPADSEYHSREKILRGGVAVQKRDAGSGKSKPQGGASLAGGVFDIISLNDNPVIVEGHAYERNQTVLSLTLDENGAAQSSADALPYGSYLIRETRAPEGYLMEGTLEKSFEVTENGVIVDMTSEEASLSDRVIRGDLTIYKSASDSKASMAGIPFRITSKTTGESHIMLTDENGKASTAALWNLHTANTNRGESAGDGIWFRGSSDEDMGENPDDSVGALPYDTYDIEEMATEANQGYQLITWTCRIYKDNETIELTRQNEPEEPETPEEPEKPEEAETPEEPENPKETEKVTQIVNVNQKQTGKVTATAAYPYPKTGDDSRPGLYLLLLADSAAVMLLTAVGIRRRRHFRKSGN